MASSITRPRTLRRKATHDQTLGVASVQLASARCSLLRLCGAEVLCCGGGYQCGGSFACTVACDSRGRRRRRSSRRHPSQWVALSSTGNEIQFPRDQDGRSSFLLIDADGYAAARSADFVVRERMPNLAVELIPEVPAPVRGRLVDQAGKAVEGARVRVARQIYGNEQAFPWGLEYTTGTDGHFEIKHARIGDRIQVRIEKPGTGGAESDWMSLDRIEPRILPDLRVGPPDQDLGGIVRDYDGFAVENAKVIHMGEPRVETTTDAEGKLARETATDRRQRRVRNHRNSAEQPCGGLNQQTRLLWSLVRSCGNR